MASTDVSLFEATAKITAMKAELKKVFSERTKVLHTTELLSVLSWLYLSYSNCGCPVCSRFYHHDTKTRVVGMPHASSLNTHLFVCLSACLPVCLSACLPVCLPACLPVCLSVFAPSQQLEGDLDAYQEALASHGDTDTIVDANGFPRADIDVHTVMTLKNQVARMCDVM
jgi:Nas2 N_terminal domain